MAKIWHPTPPPFYNFKRARQQKSINASSFIYEVGETDLLRKQSKEIPLKLFKTPDMQAKFKYLKDCLIGYRKITGYGRGITAVQVGLPISFSAIYTAKKVQNKTNNKNVSYKDIIIVANPKILKVSKKLLKYPEMCMSLSPVIIPTTRPSWVEFEYFDEEGKKNVWTTKDNTEVDKMMNRVFLHELDHIQGIINIDKLKNPKEVILHSDPNFYASAKFERVI